MAQVIITINRREYAISCENGTEGHILRLGNLLDSKAKALTSALGQINENQLLAMVGLIIADELSELKKSTQTQAQTSTSEPSTDLSAIDEELSSHINSLNDVIKSIATNLKSV
jgi:cell division protein ZapA